MAYSRYISRTRVTKFLLISFVSLDSEKCFSHALMNEARVWKGGGGGGGGGVLIPHSRSFFTRIPYPELFVIAFPNPVFLFSEIHLKKDYFLHKLMNLRCRFALLVVILFCACCESTATWS